ncbi:hypothetical protein CC2G_001632 [Coprinopsis cinerea AmutBmut pab1-1]|nr:hypothetical protein CC2G_001632 [Coprinopsis cinerea AmutBmut pab1-1]
MASSSSTERILKRANPSTIQGKFLVGYQGWFTCAGDGEPIGPGHHGWLHWLNHPIPNGGRPNLDLWPDVSSYDPSELYEVPGLKNKNGEPVHVFSSRNPKTVQRHFRWMAEHGVDGAFLQRFAGECDPSNEGHRRLRDEVGDRVREAAEQEGRVFAIMYDVTGVPAERIQHILVQDWLHLIRQKRILDSPAYLKEKGRPVVALWGFGFENRGHTPAMVRAIAQFFRNTTPGGVYLMAGTPTHWRTAEGDSDRNPEWPAVWLNEFDAISPWTIGRYKTEEEADSFAENSLKGDFERIQQNNHQTGRKVDYIPVVWPGGSGHNLSEGKWGFNDAPRKGGRFLWKQIFNAYRVGARIMYGAMWDEYDEGTALMPAVTHKHKLPVSERWTFMALDQDGHDLPSDWYMRICGFAGEVLRGERRVFETFPSKELQDYWSTRPKYEERAITSTEGSSSSSGASIGGSSNQGGQSYEEWLDSQQKSQEDEAPPPPYTLEAEEPVTSPPAPAATASSTPPTVAPAAAATSSVPQPIQGPAPTGPTVAGPQTQISDRPVGNTAPPANVQTYPAANQAYNYGGPAAPTGGPIAPAPSDPVANLTNDFGRVGLSGPAGGQPVVSGGPTSAPYPPTRISPPPVHPAHPAAHQRPPTRPPTTTGTQSPPASYSRPQSSHSNAAGPSPTNPPVSTHSTGTWAAPQWPPSDWRVPGGASSNPATSGAPAQGSGYPGGANLSRPQTFTASSMTQAGSTSLHHSQSVHHSSSLRPPAPPAATRPQSAQGNTTPATAPTAPAPYPPPNMSTTAPPTPYGAPGSGYGNMPPYGSSYPSNNMPSGPSGYGGPPAPGSSYVPPGNPNFPSGPVRTSTLDDYGAQSSGYPSYHSTAPSFPANSYPSSSDPNQPPTWSGGHSPHTSPPISPGPQTVNANFPGGPGYPSQPPSSYPSFPYGPGGEAPGQYGNTSMPQAHGHYQPPPPSGPYGPTYPNPQHGGTPSSYPQPSSPTSFPTASHPTGTSTPIGNQSMPWPGGSATSSTSGPPPSLPPRPSNYGGYGHGSSSSKPSGISFPAAGSSALGLAWSAVDKVAGRKTREQLESQVGNLAQSGSKLFSKFTK